MTLTRKAGGLSLAWPLEAGLLPLQTSTNLAPPVQWSLATNFPMFLEGHWNIEVQPSGIPFRFYRLQAP